MLIAVFCAGEMVWRERDKKVASIYDTLPVADSVPFLGKLGALIRIQALLMMVLMMSGMLLQILHGYYSFEPLLYIRELFFIRLPFFAMMSLLALFFQAMINSKLLGHVVMILYLSFEEFIPEPLFEYATPPVHTYSEMNGYGPFSKPLMFYNLYWGAFAVVLVTVALLFWVRGNDTALKSRLKAIKPKLGKGIITSGTVGLLAFLSLGFFIYYNTHVLNPFSTPEAVDEKKVEYERRFSGCEKDIRPKVTDVKLSVDLYPYDRKLHAAGTMVLLNKSGKEINEIFVQAPKEGTVGALALDVPNTLKESAPEHGVYIYTLGSPLQPGDKTVLTFDYRYAEKGFKGRGFNTRLVDNGTFLELFHLMPAIGYDPYYFYELKDKSGREKYQLPAKERIPAISDRQALMRSPMGKDSDWINFEAVLSTAGDQTAFTSGDLVRQWEKDGRRYFSYKAADKIQKAFPVVSARYTVARDQWRDVGIEIYYHEGHHYNIDLIKESVKQSLDYCSENFGPYPFKTIKVVEAARYEIGAEAYPNIIPMSEDYGFIARFDGSKVEYVFRVVAHEVAHQWWGMQVMGSYVEGVFLMSEVLAQYSALMICKKRYDKDKISAYIEERIKTYFRGRSRETDKEVPLVSVNLDTAYANYHKGIVVMNALQAYIGEDRVNEALRKYVADTAFREPPYTTSLEFMGYLREVTPTEYLYLLEDMFETITLFDNRMISADYKKMEDGKFLVTLKYDAAKFRADEKGEERQMEMNDELFFGVLDSTGKTLYLERHRVQSGAGELEFVLEKEPQKAGIDPHFLLVDKNTENNMIGCKRKDFK
ncbi:MAG: M1 family metallopeptidase, partial [bacterium]|nr:M1 family metallopeptidase [bacterium]